MERTDFFDGDLAGEVALNENVANESRLGLKNIVGSGPQFHSLPDELLSLVIEYGYFTNEGGLPDTMFRANIMLTSRGLRDITLETPSAWSIVQLYNLKDTHGLHHLPIYLGRSKEYPLEIYLDVVRWNREMLEEVMSHLLHHSGRWRRVSFCFEDDHILSYIHDASMPILESLDISFGRWTGYDLRTPIFGMAPQRLTHLCFVNTAFSETVISFRALKFLELRGYRTVLDFAKTLKMLQGANLLQELILTLPSTSELSYGRFYETVQEPRITLPELRYLELYTPEWISDERIKVIQFFSAPKIRSLIVREGYSACPERSRIFMSYNTDSHPPHSPRFYQPIPIGDMTFGDPYKRFFVHDHPGQGDATLQLALRTLSCDMIKGIVTLAVDYSSSAIHLSKRYPQMFFLPTALSLLTSVSFKAIASIRWGSVTRHFADHVDLYPNLASLELLGAADVLSADPGDNDFTKGFPLLRCLTLDGVSANTFIKQLLPSSEAPYPFPDFEVLSICNDSNISKPLLYQMIEFRRKMGKPLMKLYLDRHFSANRDSWDYIKGLVDLCEL